MTILRALLRAGDHDDQAAIETLRAAATRPPVPGSSRPSGPAQAIASRLIWAGPRNIRTHHTRPGSSRTRYPDAHQQLICWNDYATALEDMGPHEEALAAFDRALDLNPNGGAAHTNRGNVLSSLGRYEQALTAYDRALDLNPNNAAAHTNRGNVLAA